MGGVGDVWMDSGGLAGQAPWVGARRLALHGSLQTGTLPGKGRRAVVERQREVSIA